LWRWESKKNLNLEKFYEEIDAGLQTSRKAFTQTALMDDEGHLRSLQEAKLILGALKTITLKTQEVFKEYPSLESIYEKEFGPIKHLQDREGIIETCFVDDFLLPESESYPFIEDQTVTNELIDNYVASFSDWCEDIIQKHQESQTIIKERFDLELKASQLPCQCIKCTADFRAKIRDTLFKEQVDMIDVAEEELHELILEQKISYLSDYVQKLKKRLDRNQHKVRYKLKRGSLNKLDSDVKAHFKRKFAFNTELGKVYKERLISFFNTVLEDKEIKPDMISPEEYERFFTQLGVGIWKSPQALKREFEKLVNSVMAFKRKDISATILRDYLGQFWVHSEARRKNRRVIYHMGPTNSGKTYNAIQALAAAKNGCYLAPLRLLASELYDTLNEKGAKTSLLTGEEVIETDGATHYSSTIEMAKLSEDFECAVIDEIQMITDPQRGWAWTRALVSLNADEIHLCGDHSVFELVKQILELTGDTLEVNSYERKTSLSVMNKTIKLVDLDKNDALIVFSRRNALKYKRDLENLGFKVSIVYGRLSPEVRREQARKFDEGETDIMVSTDAIAMGMNLPVKRIVFSTLSKFFNSKEHPITISEIKQIAGRAGRYQRFPEGFTTTLAKVEDGLERLNEALHHDLEQKELAMVGPDLDIFRSVNQALEENSLPTLSLTEFLRLFNTMTFEKPFYCVDLKEMIEVAEMVENADEMGVLSDAEIFGFACAPVNLGLMDHVQYFVWILNHFVTAHPIINEPIDGESDDIDYLETAIKCVELYQWLARHFQNKHFSFDESELLENKTDAIEKLNSLLSEKISKRCSSCGCKLPDSFNFNICEVCFGQRRTRRPRRFDKKEGSSKDKSRGNNSNRKFKNSSSSSGKGPRTGAKKKSRKSNKNKAAAFKRG
jgi:ATP-dependent RNA helicase SUPV3L1/SUV3